PLEVIPAPAAGAAAPVERELHVAVTNGTKGAADVRVSLELPAGWSVTPPIVPIAFGHEDESLSARFTVVAPAQVKPGSCVARAFVAPAGAAGVTFRAGYQDIEYPH